MKLTRYELGSKPFSTKKPNPARHRAMYSIIHDESYIADLACGDKAPVVAQRWGLSPNTVRQHRCNLRKAAQL